MGNIIDFIFDEKKLSDFGYILVDFDSPSDEYVVSEISYETFKASNSDIWIRSSASYESPLSCTLSIMKNPCVFYDDIALTRGEVEELTRWLSRKQYKTFRFVESDDSDPIYHEAKINIKCKKNNGQIIGLILEIETNRPYGYSPMPSVVMDVNKGNEIAINVSYDDEGDFYPDYMSVMLLEDGDLKIENKKYTNVTTIKNCVAGEEIVFNGKTLQISSSLKRIFGDDECNYVFPKFVQVYGEDTNIFTFSLNCRIIINYNSIRKVGMYYG